MKYSRILIILSLIIINIMFLNINKVYAESISDVIKGGDSFIDEGSKSDSVIDEKAFEGNLQSFSKTLNGILIIVGMVIAVVITGILGIKFMIGSVEEKAEVKKSLIPFIIGCVIVFGAFGIWRIFIVIGHDISDEGSIKSTTTPYNKNPWFKEPKIQ